MSDGKRYFWLRLKDDFFDSRRIKKLRRLAGGDTFTIIYLKLQLVAMKHDGILKWTGLEESVADELALEINEDPDNVEVTLRYLLSCGLAETSDNVNFFFPYAVENVGSEGASAQRVRDFRTRKALQSNVDETPVKRLCNGEIEKEKDIEIEKEVDNSEPRKHFKPPTLQEVTDYCNERGNNIQAQHFIDYYEARNWMLGKTKMKDWKAAVRTWERNEPLPQPKRKTTADEVRERSIDLDELRKKLAAI